MIEVLTSILICTIIFTGAYYGAHYVVNLRHNRNTLADELTRATAHIEELETRIMMLESERDIKAAQMEARSVQPSGWDTMNVRG